MMDEKRLAEILAYTSNTPTADHTIAMVLLKDFKEMGATLDALLKIARAAQRVREHRRLWYPFRIEERELLRDELDKALDALKPVEEKEKGK